ncbi:MAG: exonuclease subunit SbcD [Bacteroidales bacterium]|nr:exonuclease subunit SbcD [Bacteroidales bacterium]
MLTILHTADWHLGKQLCGYDRTNEFINFFDKLKSTISEKKPNILIIAGDIFDNATPSNSVSKQYYELIADLNKNFPNLEILIIGGNHDSPSFLNAPAEILKFFRAKVVGCVPRKDGEIDWNSMIYIQEIKNKPVAVICAIPFLRRGDLATFNVENATEADFYNEVFNRAKILRQNLDIPIIATGHLTMVGAEYSTKNGNQVGGQENVSENAFPDDIDYVALGHIHRQQPVKNKKNAFYSGSPLPFSFAEKNYQHSMSFVTFENGEQPKYESIKLPNLVPLKVIPENPSSLEEVKIQLENIPDNQDMFLEVNLADELRSMDTKQLIITEFLKNKKAKFCGFKNNNIIKNDLEKSIFKQMKSEDDFKNTNPIDIIKDIYKNKLKTNLDEKYVDMLNSIIQEINQQQ